MNEYKKLFIHNIIRRLRALDKRQALKAAAYDVFSKKGYKETGISEIAKRAGVAVGSFYNYYNNKEAIFLDVYVEENNRVRQAMMDNIDWQQDLVELVRQIFEQSRSLVSSNKILAEWHNPAVSRTLRGYYSSGKGKATNTFHQFLVETFTGRMVAEGYSEEKIQDILQVYNLFYYMDIHITESDFPGIGRTLEVLATTFAKGILHNEKG